MKKSLIALVLLLSFGITQIRAQLFQKIKDKVNNKLNGNNPQNKPGTGTNGSTQPFTDFAKYNISTTVAAAQNGIAGKTHAFNAAHSIYKVGAGGPVADVVFFGSDRDLGEAQVYQTNDQAYIYENGQLMGQKTVGDIQGDDSYNADKNRQDYPQLYAGNMAEFMSQSYPPQFTFNGKTYSEYMMTFKPTISSDKSKFYAIGGENENDGMTYYLFSAGKKIKLPAMASNIMVNADFSAAGAYGFVNQVNTDENQSGSAMMQSAGNALSHSDVYFADGSVIKNGGMTLNAWLDPTGKNILSSDAQNGNFVNGKQISTEGSQPGDLWCGADGSHWAYFKNTGSGQPGHLKFYDGADIPNAVNPRQMVTGGKTYVVWLQYKDLYSGDLLFCTKEL
ncbi:MAG TPA: hypothetical protein VFE53_17160 [Mucilaginibacter sp.]|jgi:hypothetical protein|nr:hypothetical protein [Mucilaginibacter sp.]